MIGFALAARTSKKQRRSRGTSSLSYLFYTTRAVAYMGLIISMSRYRAGVEALRAVLGKVLHNALERLLCARKVWRCA